MEPRLRVMKSFMIGLLADAAALRSIATDEMDRCSVSALQVGEAGVRIRDACRPSGIGKT
jgi:hypothetical protein